MRLLLMHPRRWQMATDEAGEMHHFESEAKPLTKEFAGQRVVCSEDVPRDEVWVAKVLCEGTHELSQVEVLGRITAIADKEEG